MDLALNPKDRELYRYDGISWQLVDKFEFLDNAVAFFDEQDFNYSARSIESIMIQSKSNPQKWEHRRKS